MKVLRDANTDLRGSLEDASKKILGLEQAVHILEEKVDNLEKRNKNLEDLVIVALKQYFLENPTIASAIETTLKEK